MKTREDKNAMQRTGLLRHSPTSRLLTPAPVTIGGIEAFILLAGSLRPTALLTGAGRSVLDLPLEAGYTLQQHWMMHAERLSTLRDRGELPVRILVNEPQHPATEIKQGAGVRAAFETDPQEYRGTGGVLRDVVSDYADDSLILVSFAAGLLMEDIREVVASLAELESDVAILTHEDGTASGPMLIRCGVLRSIADVGFVDFKEQAIPVITAQYTVKATARSVRIPNMRARAGYLQAVKQYHWHHAGIAESADPFVEDWKSSFAVVEPGAKVAATAVIHDSVVLDGGQVDAGAVVVRSVVCPGGVVVKNETVMDQVVVGRSRGN